jgi:hypothetical protein
MIRLRAGARGRYASVRHGRAADGLTWSIAVDADLLPFSYIGVICIHTILRGRVFNGFRHMNHCFRKATHVTEYGGSQPALQRAQATVAGAQGQRKWWFTKCRVFPVDQPRR